MYECNECGSKELEVDSCDEYETILCVCTSCGHDWEE